MDNYPKIKANATLEEINAWASAVQRTREKDVVEFENLSKIFMSGRKVNKIPTASSDVAASDRVGDFNYDLTKFYLLVDDGTLEWRHMNLSHF